MPFVTSSVLSVLDTPARQLSRIVHTATINIVVPATLSIAPKIRTETGLCSVSKKTGKPRYKNKNSRNLHGNFHEFHKTNFVLSDLVCLYSLLFLMKHFHKIATIKAIMLAMEINLNSIALILSNLKLSLYFCCILAKILSITSITVIKAPTRV